MNPLAEMLAARLVRRGTLIVTDADGVKHRYGDETGQPVHVRINSKRAERAVAFDPALKLGECYMNGDLDMVEGSIYGLLELVFTNAGPNLAVHAPWMRGLRRLRRIRSGFGQVNTMARSRRNVQHHYDLSSSLYDLFLDSDRQYSCAYYPKPGVDLDHAQFAKKQHLASKLFMKKPGLSVLDIGSGWGGLGLYLAEQFGAEVTGVTLSDEQHAYSNARVPPARQDQVRFLLKDFRAVDERYDRIVSVGMFEHVGMSDYDRYFTQVARLLKDDGIMVLHSIGNANTPSATNPFIAKYIFPGGHIPSLSQVLPAIERAGLYVTDIEILRLHYAETLSAWRERFISRREEAKALYDERFCRMWEFYLASSEAAFRWQKLMVFQIQLAHDQAAVPLTRDYMFEAERELTAPPARQRQRRAG